MSGNTSSTGGFIAPAASPVVLEDTALTDLLQAMVVGITGLTASLVRPRWQPVPPTQPSVTTTWCAIGITDRTPDPGTAWVGHDPTGDGTDQMQRHEVLTVLLSFYGPNAAAMAGRLGDGLYIAQNRETLYHAGAGLVDVGASLTFGELVNGQFVSRCDMPITVRRVRARIYPVENLLEGPVNLESNGP